MLMRYKGPAFLVEMTVRTALRAEKHQDTDRIRSSGSCELR